MYAHKNTNHILLKHQLNMFYKINDLSMDLINAGLSYTIVNTQTNSVVKTGLFSELIDTDSSVPDEVIILDTNKESKVC